MILLDVTSPYLLGGHPAEAEHADLLRDVLPGLSGGTSSVRENTEGRSNNESADFPFLTIKL